ncbi:YoaK family protein [Rhizobium sp. A22-96]
MKPSLSTLLSINGGYVDTAGFLALHGLFTAHVTGNFVTLGATLALGTSGAVAKLLALPVFCVVVVLARLLGGDLSRRNLPTLQIVLTLKFFLLVLAAFFAMRFGPFADGDGWQAIVTGMTLIAAMAIQTTAHRIHLGSTPPTTMMTGTTTQIMIDIADLLRGAKPEEKAATKARLGRMGAAVGGFALGCAVAATLFLLFGMVCFLLPPVLALAGILMHAGRSAKPA